MRILLGMSGGVDSTYAALKLKKEGHEVEGAVLIMHEYSPVSDAMAAAAALDIPLHVIDCSEAFGECVIGNFISEYTAARTPNPCVICNSEIKFKRLLDYALDNGFDAIATGHYAKIVAIDKSGNATLKTLEFVNNNLKNGTHDEYRYAVSFSNDAKKDQTYMLWRLSQSVLRYLVFPLAEERKEYVKSEAASEGLISPERKESQEICFIPDGKYTEYIEARAGKCMPGSFVDTEGRTLGAHKGIIHYTVGQRKGLDIALGRRVFVTEINPTENTVTLEDAPRLSDTVTVEDIVFSKIERPEKPIKMRLAVKLRYLASPAMADVTVEPSGNATLRFSEGQRSVTPGQAAVFYDGDGCVFSGIITK